VQSPLDATNFENGNPTIRGGVSHGWRRKSQ